MPKSLGELEMERRRRQEITLEQERRRRLEMLIVLAVVSVVGGLVYGAYLHHAKWAGATLVKICEGGRVLEHRPIDNTYWVSRKYRVPGPSICGKE